MKHHYLKVLIDRAGDKMEDQALAVEAGDALLQMMLSAPIIRVKCYHQEAAWTCGPMSALISNG